MRKVVLTDRGQDGSPARDVSATKRAMRDVVRKAAVLRRVAIEAGDSAAEAVARDIFDRLMELDAGHDQRVPVGKSPYRSDRS